MNEKIKPLVAKSIRGDEITIDESRRILHAKGAELTAYMAGAHGIKEHYFADRVDLCSIINAKSGHCPENCSFCAQSLHHQAEVPIYPLRSVDEIVLGAMQAQRNGSHCYGIVTSGTRIKPGDEFSTLLSALRRINRETTIAPSVSLGILDAESAKALFEAGCKTYHHNLETARSYFPQICTTHDYQEDIETIICAKKAGLKTCCGGIFGLGESIEQRIELGMILRELDVDSVPLNFLSPVAGTPLQDAKMLSPMDCLRIICLYRYLLPDKHITVCGGREKNLGEFQSAIFMAGASGMMIGNYLTTSGRNHTIDEQMLIDAEVTINV
ncbi:MAG: biotin synthase BioB [Desulfuromonadales bacterium]|nr:biotin synthase BioB [Desulfuromonadales bacterium]